MSHKVILEGREPTLEPPAVVVSLLPPGSSALPFPDPITVFGNSHSELIVSYWHTKAGKGWLRNCKKTEVWLLIYGSCEHVDSFNSSVPLCAHVQDGASSLTGPSLAGYKTVSLLARAPSRSTKPKFLHQTGLARNFSFRE